ncbi:short-subunit dehydrogenase [Acidovorax sp. 30]|nr:short-subunit dehydrogenase [Acidovorax sp. 59]PKW04192.1 short-subunit dehydrogenase [Acidovorax sp. 30]
MKYGFPTLARYKRIFYRQAPMNLVKESMQTILITGCSSGFGLETARYFLARGWNVVATMRNPQHDLFGTSDRIRVLPLDVTDANSIWSAVASAGPIDVLVNNAGFGAVAPLELVSMETARALFETNTIGVLAVTQAVLPGMRDRGSGVIVNVTSSVTYKPLPLVGAYRAAKAAVNALSESLAHEVEQFGIRVRVVLPGSSSETRFRESASAYLRGLEDESYGDFMRKTMTQMRSSIDLTTQPQDVAEAVWRAATDSTAPFRLPAGADAAKWAAEED